MTVPAEIDNGNQTFNISKYQIHQKKVNLPNAIAFVETTTKAKSISFIFTISLINSSYCIYIHVD